MEECIFDYIYWILNADLTKTHSSGVTFKRFLHVQSTTAVYNLFELFVGWLRMAYREYLAEGTEKSN